MASTLGEVFKKHPGRRHQPNTAILLPRNYVGAFMKPPETTQFERKIKIKVGPHICSIMA